MDPSHCIARRDFCAGLLAGLATVPAAAAGADAGTLQITCAPERPVMRPGESVRLNVWIADSRGLVPDVKPRLQWSTEHGRIDPGDGSATWTVPADPVVPGNSVPISATLRVIVGSVVAGQYTARAAIAAPLPPDSPRGRALLGRALLLPGAAEPAGFCLTSYLLLPAVARDDEDRARQLRAIGALLRAVPPMEELLEYRKQAELAISLVPVTRKPVLPDLRSHEGLAEAATRLLAVYDHTRAQVLLADLDRSARQGPYLACRPRAAPGAQLAMPFFDMSRVVPKLVGDWVDAFCALVLQEPTWTDVTVRKLLLDMRNVIAVAARLTPDVLGDLDRWARLVDRR
jgi:hypothetical protein